MIKAILFDCYGVLLGHGFWHTYAAAGGNVRTDSEFIRTKLHAMNEGTLSVQQFDEIVADHLRIGLDTWQDIKRAQELPDMRLFHFIEDTLKPKYKIGMISNAGSGSIERKLSTQQLNLFDARVISAEVGFLKPDREMYELAAEKLAVKVENCVFIDDYPGYVKAAEDIGMRGILYTNFEDFKAQIITILKAS